jgi:hybrid cluster-associated redox disulfide protein
MEHPMPTPTTLLADLLDSSPQAANLLIDLHAGCIGCSMNKFCTLEDMCRLYGLDVDHVISLFNELLGYTILKKNHT